MPYKLLIAEHELPERQALCRVLQAHLSGQLTILEAATGAQALSIYSREHPHIIILNTELPDLSGLEVARQIRSGGQLCGILFITDADQFSYARQAISLRALDYILKPYDERKLVLSVEEAIRYCSHFQTLPRYPQAAADPAPAGQEPESPRLSLVREDIRAYLEAHYMEELSMKNVAHAMNYSDAYFCKLFKQCFQVNFSTYLNQYRIEKAKAMMETSRASLKEIGLACGYPDPNYFARVFKRITDQTPSEYRLNLAGKW